MFPTVQCMLPCYPHYASPSTAPTLVTLSTGQLDTGSVLCFFCSDKKIRDIDLISWNITLSSVAK